MTGYRDVAGIYLERGYLPFPVKGKRPPVAGATGLKGSVTPDLVAAWSIDPEWRDQNVGLRHHLTVGIDVDHYGPKNGADQLAILEAKLGPLPATPSSTSRGADSPARQHLFALREPILMQGKPPIPGVALKEDVHIDVIQASHRYSVVWPSVNPDADNAPYLWYDAEGELMDGPPHVDELEYLPEAWIDYLRVDEREYAHTGQQWEGELPETASPDEERKLRAIVARLQSLPEVWAPGAGWHDIVFQAACWLWRIARSNAYAVSPDEALQLLLEHTPTYPSWGVDKVIEQWESADKTTVGQYEEPPAPPVRPLLPWQGFPTSVRYPEIAGQPFALVWAHVPSADRAAEHRRALIEALVAGHVHPTEIATLVWNSGAARAPQMSFGGVTISDPHGKAMTIESLWAEVDAAIARRDSPQPEQAAQAVAAPELPTPVAITLETPRLSFLNELERQAVAAYAWWGARFLHWAQQTFSAVNLPYYRMNRWAVLSIIFGSKGVLPRPGANDRPLNLYMCIVGRTTSGKTEALRAAEHVLEAYYILDENPDIGGNHTNESLPRLLVEKDGKPTFFNLDEAHTKIPTWRRQQSYASEIPGILTRVYDGKQAAIYRNTDKELSGKSARVFMTVHLMGTPTGMADVMGPEDWESGFLNRFIWGIGDAPVDTIDSIAGDWIEEDELGDEYDVSSSGREMYQQWAAEFSAAIMKVDRSDHAPQRMKLPRAVIDRHKQFVEDLQRVGSRGPYVDRLRPTFKRLNETVLRCAALVALSDGRTRVELKDMLVAIEQAEEWVANIMTMVEATDESIRTRMVNGLERALLEHGGVMPVQQIHRLPRFKDQARETMGLIDELISQGRAQWMEPQKQTLIAKGVASA